MKAWHIDDIKHIKLVDDVLPRLEGEVKLKVSKVAVSSTDISFFAGEEGDISVPGHSAIAYVSEADDGSSLKLGARAVISPFIKCEEHGEKIVKIMGVDVNGLLQDFVSVPFENVYTLPDGIADEEAIYAGYIATGIKILSSIDSEKGDFIVIVGASTLGMILAQLAVYYQMVPILIDLDADKLKMAENWGIYYTLNPTLDNLERRVEEITGGRMCEYGAFVGDGVSLSAVLRLVKNNGEVVIGGYTSHAKHQVDMDIVLKKQLTLKGICNGDGEMSSAINLLANRIIKTEGLINSRIAFADVPEMVENCAKYPYQYNKILIDVE